MRAQFGAFRASELYCPKCKRSQPARERLLLVLPAGELHEYLCSHCATSLGTREVKQTEQAGIARAVPAHPARKLLLK